MSYFERVKKYSFFAVLGLSVSSIAIAQEIDSYFESVPASPPATRPTDIALEHKTFNGTLSGVEAVLRDKELDLYLKSEKHKLGDSSNGSASTMRASSPAMNDIASFARSSSTDCSWVWRRSWSSGAYWQYVWGYSLKVSIDVLNKTWYGGPNDPLSCLEKWYFSDLLEHSGKTYRFANSPLVTVSGSRHNEAYLSSYNSSSYRSFPFPDQDIERPKKWDAQHKFVIGSSTYLHGTSGSL